MDKWINKVAVVTGASSGIGKDISVRLVSHGIKVIGCGRNIDNLRLVKEGISKTSEGEFIPFKCDVSNEEEVLSLFNFVKNNYAGLHICINNAGLFYQSSILNGKTEDWTHMMGVNVIGLSMCAREAYKLMKENENKDDVPGHIINVSSLGGHFVSPVSTFHFYCASKFAVTAISEGIRQELREAKSNVRVTQVSPGYVETDFQRRGGGDELVDRLKLLMPNPLQACDISDGIIFALSAPARSSVHDIMIRPNY